MNLTRSGDRWSGGGAEIDVLRINGNFHLILRAPKTPVHRVHLRWAMQIPENAIALGDAWERSYGDLAWLPLQADRVLPWYCLIHWGNLTSGVGVKTGAAAFAFWQVDTEGISLWLDVCNGGNGVELSDRSLDLATVITRTGDDPWYTAQLLCDGMTEGTHVATHRGKYPVDTIYGSNDWYYAYGKNTADGILRDAKLVRELAPSGAPSPFTVIDDGYRDPHAFPSLPRLAEQIRALGVGPGIWIRPTLADKDTPSSLLLPQTHWVSSNTKELALDPTIPEARARVLKVVLQACEWGFDFIKHDFTTYELLGQWGYSMGGQPTQPGWSFNDRTHTNAEIIRDLYRDIRKTTGNDRLILGCNTVGHLAAGIFDAQRTGDDVSGRIWDRTRRMGVNTLAFRMPQHGRFFTVDADCIPITPDIAWTHTEAWLHAVAASGSALLISPDPRSIGQVQKHAIKQAFAECVSHSESRPLDWLNSRVPSRWQQRDGLKQYKWLDNSGASPFLT